MVRILVEDLFTSEGSRYIEAAGLSTDTKPEDSIVTGSKFTEVDTGDEYRFNEAGDAGSKWVKSNPGGGGGGGGGALLVEAELQGQKYYTKTKAADIFAAFSAGQPVIIHFLPDEQFVPEDTVIMMAYMQHTNNQYITVLSYEEGTFNTNGNASEDGYIEFSVQ